MTKNQQRDVATSLTILVFIIVGTTGTLMFFHLFDAYTKQMHEYLGLVFVVAALLHVLVHIKSTKQYFTKKVFLGFFVILLGVVIAFTSSVKEGGVHPKKLAFDKLFGSSIEKSFVLFTPSVDEAKFKLESAGLKLDDAATISQIAKLNKTSPFEIISIISK